MSDHNVNVFFDYTCPWVRQAGFWLIDLENKSKIDINWKPFLLEQINSDNNEEWKAWNQNLDQYLSRGIWPLGSPAWFAQGDGPSPGCGSTQTHPEAL